MTDKCTENIKHYKQLICVIPWYLNVKLSNPNVLAV